MNAEESFFIPDWPLPDGVRALITTRQGGVSQGAFAGFNLATHVGDAPELVAQNRARLSAKIQATPVWLNQVHGTRVVDAALFSGAGLPPDADAAFSRQAGHACLVMSADCLPVLFCAQAGNVVAAAHAGWRGLLAGVLENTVKAMGVPGTSISAYLGPAIGPRAFTVGDEVYRAFVAQNELAQAAFVPASSSGTRWRADLYQLARQRLAALGMTSIYGGKFCSFTEGERFFSYRRDAQTGRMASLIWRAV